MNVWEFLTAIKTECNFDQIYVTTPKGDAIKLPEGATALDFAYAVHSDIGDRCMGVKVDGKIVPLDYKLKTGQRCEALVYRKLVVYSNNGSSQKQNKKIFKRT